MQCFTNPIQNKTCSKCGKSIEESRIKQGYCLACHSEYMKNYRILHYKPAIRKVAKITCSKCNKLLEETRRGKYRYCKTCHSEYSRINGKKLKYCDQTETNRLKNICRSKTKVYIKRGKLIKEPCYNCGNHNVQAHHSDYTNPFKVHWLCKDCHVKLHFDINLANKINSMPPTVFILPRKKLFYKKSRI